MVAGDMVTSCRTILTGVETATMVPIGTKVKEESYDQGSQDFAVGDQRGIHACPGAHCRRRIRGLQPAWL
jgi:hypothetical protein